MSPDTASTMRPPHQAGSISPPDRRKLRHRHWIEPGPSRTRSISRQPDGLAKNFNKVTRTLGITWLIAILALGFSTACAQNAPSSSLDDLQRQINEAKAKSAARTAKRTVRSSAVRSHFVTQGAPPRNLDASQQQGNLQFAGGVSYDGTILNGQPNGQGAITDGDGRFQGNFTPGHASGAWGNGATYDGGFTDGYRNGYGVASYPNGDRYEGYWLNGRKNGFGVETWPDGQKFQGQYLNDHPNGQGTLWGLDNQMLSGNWVNGCFNDGTHTGHVTVDASSCGQ